MDDDIAGIILQYNDTYHQETLCLIIACMHALQAQSQIRLRSGASDFWTSEGI